MILLNKEKKIILTPAKCGSSTLDYIFTKSPLSDGILCHGPQFGLPDIEKHTNVIPYEVQNRFQNTGDTGTVIVAVRNPYTRALSIYNHYLRFDHKEEDINSFTDFVKYRLVVGGHYFSQTIYELCKRISFPIPMSTADNVFWPSYMIHLETMREDIEGLGYSFDNYPKLNRTPEDEKYATMDDYTPKTIQLVRMWGEMDFSCFGYYHDFDKHHLVKENNKGLAVVPPRDFMGSYGNNSFFRYLNSGKASFAEVKENMLRVCDINIDEQERVLDFGCGAGRVTRNFDSDMEIHGTDLRGDIVDWANENLPYEFHTNTLNCNLSFDNNYFDFILSLSVFSHIKALKKWLDEVTRTLKEGGILYLSINDEEAVIKASKVVPKLDYFEKIKLDLAGFIQGRHPVLWDGYFSFVQRDYFLSLLPPSMKLLGIADSETFETAYIFRKNTQ